jgi:hypothetical protein
MYKTLRLSGVRHALKEIPPSSGKATMQSPHQLPIQTRESNVHSRVGAMGTADAESENDGGGARDS